jgi:hypothetical protein
LWRKVELPFSASWTLVAVPVAVVVDMSDEHRSDSDEEVEEGGVRAPIRGGAPDFVPRDKNPRRGAPPGPARALDH